MAKKIAEKPAKNVKNMAKKIVEKQANNGKKIETNGEKLSKKQPKNG